MIIYREMKVYEKNNFTGLFKRGGGVNVDVQDGEYTYQAWLVPSGNRPGHRTIHLFKCPIASHKPDDYVKYMTVADKSKIKALEIPPAVKKLLVKGLATSVSKTCNNQLKQDLLCEATDTDQQTTYGIFKLPKGWRLDGVLQLFKRSISRTGTKNGWSYVTNYQSFKDVCNDNSLPKNIRMSLAQSA